MNKNNEPRNWFVTLFLPYTDSHLFKDPGQLPYRFQKIGFEGHILTTEKKGIKESQKYINVDFLKQNIFPKHYIISMLWYFGKNAKKIKILNVFHFSWNSLMASFIYKLLNPRGFTYLKLDICYSSGPYEWESVFDNRQNILPGWKRHLMRNLFFRKVDLWSVEDEESKEYYISRYPVFKNKLVVSYNGHTADLFDNVEPKEFEEKENIILNVGRLGSYQKATEILLEAFALLPGNDWILYLVGPTEEGFNEYLEKFLYERPHLQTRIILTGEINKPGLFKIYSRSRIFCLPSRYEGFANVFSEAMYFGNAIVTTKYVSPVSFITRTTGFTVERDSPAEIAAALGSLMADPAANKRFGENAKMNAKLFFNWDKIVSGLFSEIENRI